ncbi:MAG TPA: hypothetical protein PKJ34_13140 [Anaerolineaceae bacterium]|nr:hypothetical protein [Anaerolineaceae bacterium]
MATITKEICLEIKIDDFVNFLRWILQETDQLVPPFTEFEKTQDGVFYYSLLDPIIDHHRIYINCSIGYIPDNQEAIFLNLTQENDVIVIDPNPIADSMLKLHVECQKIEIVPIANLFYRLWNRILSEYEKEPDTGAVISEKKKIDQDNLNMDEIREEISCSDLSDNYKRLLNYWLDGYDRCQISQMFDYFYEPRTITIRISELRRKLGTRLVPMDRDRKRRVKTSQK